MFKAGERVWHLMFGWGVLEENRNDAYPLRFRSDTGILSGTYTNDGKFHTANINPSIFYKEQKLDMSKPEPAIGTWGYFWDDGEVEVCTFSKLTRIDNCKNKYILTDREDEYMYQHFSPEIPPHIKELMNGGKSE